MKSLTENVNPNFSAPLTVLIDNSPGVQPFTCKVLFTQLKNTSTYWWYWLVGLKVKSTIKKSIIVFFVFFNP